MTLTIETIVTMTTNLTLADAGVARGEGVWPRSQITNHCDFAGRNDYSADDGCIGVTLSDRKRIVLRQAFSATLIAALIAQCAAAADLAEPLTAVSPESLPEVDVVAP